MRTSDHGPLALPERSPLASLADRMAKAVQSGRKIKLSPSELDWFAVCGGLKAINDAATNELVEKAKARLIAQGQDLGFLEARRESDGQDEDREPVTQSASPLPDMDTDGPRRPFTPASLAARWGVSPSTIHSRMKTGSLPYFRLGSLYRIRHQDVIDYERTRDAKGKLLPKI